MSKRGFERGDSAVSLKQKFAGMNKVVFLRELGLILAVSVTNLLSDYIQKDILKT